LKEKEAAAIIILPEIVSKYMYNIYQKKAQYVGISLKHLLALLHSLFTKSKNTTEEDITLTFS
jgi:hypothetical protein